MANLRVCDVIKAKTTPATITDHIVNVSAVGRFKLDLSEAGMEKLTTVLAKHDEALEAYHELEAKLREEMEAKLAEAQAKLLEKSGLDKILDGHEPLVEVAPVKGKAAAKATPSRPVKGLTDNAKRTIMNDYNRGLKKWADEQGLAYPEKGRVPQAVKEAYQATVGVEEPTFA